MKASTAMVRYSALATLLWLVAAQAVAATPARPLYLSALERERCKRREKQASGEVQVR